MLGKTHDWFVKNLGLITEPQAGVSLMEIFGNCRLLIENHGGIISYCKNNIHIRTTFGLLIVTGADLEVIFMSDQQLVITGLITCVSLERGRR